jgi:hypothetical protein
MNNTKEIEREKELNCLPIKDLYREILKRLRDSCPGGTAERDHIVSLGFSQRTYYDIVDFAEKGKLPKGKTKPLHENTLSSLCEKLGIEFKSVMYLVKY